MEQPGYIGATGERIRRTLGSLDSRQRAVCEALAFFERKGRRSLVPMYVGVLDRLSDPDAPDAAAHAAHGARELMEKLELELDPGESVVERTTLKERVGQLGPAYEAAAKALPPDRTHWGDVTISGEIVSLLDELEKLFRWIDEPAPAHSARAEGVIRFFIGEIGDPLRAERRKEWRRLRNFFVDVSHHRRVDGEVVTVVRVAEQFTALEGFLFARWAPETVKDFSDIDALIKGGGKPDADS